MSRARRWRRAALAAALLAGLLGPAPPAGAHASLVRSTPAHRAVLGQMPERVQLWFNERLEPAHSKGAGWKKAGARGGAPHVGGGPRRPPAPSGPGGGDPLRAPNR